LSSNDTERVVRQWFDALGQGDLAGAFGLLADDVEWVNEPSVPELADILPWTGHFHGTEQVQGSFATFHALGEVEEMRLVELVVEDDRAAALIHERAHARDNGRVFETDYVEWFTVRDGRIAQWRIFIDTAPMVAAFRRGDR
jgi:ketosteroid isomerase-like protein